MCTGTGELAEAFAAFREGLGLEISDGYGQTETGQLTGNLVGEPINQRWTDDAKKMEASFATFRKKGNPFLFDAMNDTMKEVLLPLMPDLGATPHV